MRITEISLYREDAVTPDVTFDFKDVVRANKYSVKNIVGLDASQISSSYLGNYVSSGIPKKMIDPVIRDREISMLISLNPSFGTDESFSDLRDTVYKMIASSRTSKISIVFKNDTETLVTLFGSIIKVETAHFSSVPELQVTVHCDFGMLTGPSEVQSRSSDDTPYPDGYLITINDTKSTAPHPIDYLDIFVIDACSKLVIYELPEFDISLEIIPVGGFLANDIISITNSPFYDEKSVILTRAGVHTNLSDRITPGSIWPMVYPGENLYALTPMIDDIVANDLFNWLTVSYRPTYWGV